MPLTVGTGGDAGTGAVAVEPAAVKSAAVGKSATVSTYSFDMPGVPAPHTATRFVAPAVFRN